MVISKKVQKDIPKEMEDVVLASLLLRMKQTSPKRYVTAAEILSSIPLPKRKCHGKKSYLGKITEEEVVLLLRDHVDHRIVSQEGRSSECSAPGANETYNISGTHYDAQLSRLHGTVEIFEAYWDEQKNQKREYQLPPKSSPF